MDRSPGHPTKPVPGSCLGRYHTDRQPSDRHMTIRWPQARRSGYAALTGAQSQRTHDTKIRPGPHSCPFAHRSG